MYVYEELNRVKRVLRNHRPAGPGLFIFWLESIELVQLTANEVNNALGTAHTEPLYTQKYAKSYHTGKHDTKRPPRGHPLLLSSTGPLIRVHGAPRAPEAQQQQPKLVHTSLHECHAARQSSDSMPTSAMTLLT